MSPPCPDPLAADVTLAAAGDRQAFARLVGATSGLVTSVALGEVRDVDVSRDVAQDVFHHAWRDLSSLRNPRSFLPWLRQLARNRAREARARKGRALTGPEAEAALHEAADDRPGPAEQLLAAEARRHLREALDALPVEAREVLALYYREGRSAAQVGRLLELSEAAVHQRLSRARALLREDLLARAGEALVRTAPGAAFTAAVVAALPGPAAAATLVGAGAAPLALAKAAPAVLKAALAPLGPFVALLAPALGASAGVAAEIETLLATADERERRALRRWRVAAVAWMVATTALVPLAALLLRSRAAFVLSFAVFSLGWTALEAVWRPAILAPRRAAELARDPAAAGPQRRERRQRVAGLVLGLGVTAACAWLAWRWR